MTDDRLFPGWDTMLWIPQWRDAGWWASTTPGYFGEDVPMIQPGPSDLDELCRETSINLAPSTDRYLGHEFWQGLDVGVQPAGPFFEVRDGVIVAEWWRGGRWPMQSEP